MNKIACAAAILFAFSQPTLAQVPASPKTFSVATSTVGELLDNPAAKAVLQKYIPEVVANPQLEMGRDQTLPNIVQYEPSITPDKLAEIDAGLKALPPQ